MMKILNSALIVVEGALYVGAAVCLALMMLSISGDALGRYILGTPLPGVHELTEMYLLAGVVFLSIARAQRLGNHVAVESFEAFFPKGLRRVTRIVGRALGSTLFFIIAFKSGQMAWNQYMMGNMTSGAVAFPSWIGWFLVAIGSAALVLRLFLQIAQGLVNQEPDDTGSHTLEESGQ